MAEFLTLEDMTDEERQALVSVSRDMRLKEAKPNRKKATPRKKKGKEPEEPQPLEAL